MPTRIITDGACTGNPGPGGWAALILPDDQARPVEELGGHEPHTTNNRMELRAAIEGLRRVPDAAVLVITDSQYLLNGITRWLAGWRRRGWQTATGKPVENRDLWEELAHQAGARAAWEHVRGHTGDPENERANMLAQAFARGERAGAQALRRPWPAAAASGADRADPTAPTGTPGLARAIAAVRPARTTYLSLVGGQLARHTTWPACQARVHGVSGARFKKCRSAEEELATVGAWGLPAEALLTAPVV